MTTRVEINISVVMTEDPDQQNGLAISLLSHLINVSGQFEVDITDNRTHATVTTVAGDAVVITALGDP